MAHCEMRKGAHLGTASVAQDVAQGPDREPSSARSAFNCAGGVESVYARHCVRGRCEPRTARGPEAVSRCARMVQDGSKVIEYMEGRGYADERELAIRYHQSN